MPKRSSWKKDRKMVLFINTAPASIVERLRDHLSSIGRELELGILVDTKRRKTTPEQKKNLQDRFDHVLYANFDSLKSLETALVPFENKLLAITCRSESNLHDFSTIIPHVTYLRTPETKAIESALDKTLMRKRFAAYDKRITPKYTLIKDATKETIEKVQKRVGFPVVVKPAGLATSMLVSICFHEDELRKTLLTTFRKLKAQYKSMKMKTDPKVLVEQFMEGDMYSIDSYVNSRGSVHHCPPVYIETGRSIGFEDFFNYFQITPTELTAKSIKEMKKVTEKGIRALGLTNTTTHAELIRTERGWKIVEIGARIGGFRHDFYEQSFGINHTYNDILIRIPEKPVIPRKRKGYSAIVKMYAKKEGRLDKILGLIKIKKLDSIKSISVNRQPGEMCRFAKNGGKSVVNIMLFNKSRAKLLADKRRIEQSVKIQIASK
jgi:biotin carboxylase